MKTIHLSNCNTCSSEFQKIVADTVNHTFNHPHAKKRIISCGAGVVILPDTDRQHDCTPQEIVKALHLKEEIEKNKESYTESRTCYSAYHADTGETTLISLTPEQERLLNWLYKYVFISEDHIFNRLDTEKIIEI
jgi:hypothetical protein